MNIQFDTVLRLAELFSFIAGGVYMAFRLGRVTERIESYMKVQTDEIIALKEETKKVGTILTTIAVQDNRIDRLETDLHDLRHGKGWVNPLATD